MFFFVLGGTLLGEFVVSSCFFCFFVSPDLGGNHEIYIVLEEHMISMKWFKHQRVEVVLDGITLFPHGRNWIRASILLKTRMFVDSVLKYLYSAHRSTHSVL